MKKNISINISGIIFHIEEDGYETLKKYLDSINKYFSTFEDSSEILADIESRIAEIFLSKLNEEKQVITVEDVSSLVATMGSVSDFKAAEDIDIETPPEVARETAYEEPRQQSSASNPGVPPTYTAPKTLMRDQKRKILGGVCAGLGNYLNVDPLWIRLVFALLFFAYGLTFFVYVIMWIVVPGSYDLEEPIVEKKMFRDPDRKIIGGVSGGVAAFLGIDIIAVRVLFLIFTFFFGIGFFIYIVLWLILPEARTVTDRVQMQGEPVTLSNIESTLKKNQTDKPVEDETTLTKILLFPFRLIGMILTGLGRVLVPVIEVVRVFLGIVVVLLGLSLVFATVVGGGILFGIFSEAAFSTPWFNEFNESNIPLDTLLAAFPGWIAIAGFVATLVPSIFIVLLGVSVIAKRVVFNATAAWTLFVLFFISCAMLSAGIPKIVFSFKERGEYRIENTYNLGKKTAVLKINEVGMDDYDRTSLTLRGHDEKVFRLLQTFKAKGNTRARAIENARMVDYTVDVNDSIFRFDSNFRFQQDAIFRDQSLDLTLYIPYESPFVMDEGVSRFITQYVEYESMDNETWKMTEQDGLVCISCEEDEEDENDDNTSSALRDFDDVDISGRFDLKISNGGDYKVELVGPESEKAKYKVYTLGKTLVIEYQGQKNVKWDNLKGLNIEEMRINVTMPVLDKIEAIGIGSISFDDFHGDDLNIEAQGPIRIRGDVSVNDLNVTLTGKSEADFTGTATNLSARLEFASRLRAYNLDVQDAIVEVSGGSSAKVNVSQNLEIEEGLGSSVDFRGQPSVTKRD